MSDLLLFWLNHELQLSAFVTDVERDFASGYLLGELLFQLNQQHNFSDFINSSIADAKIVNFCLLEPSLRNMGVKFDSTAATAIMNGVHGAAVGLLYQIKMTAARTGRAPDVSTKSLERKAILPLHNMPVKLAKPSYDAGNHQFFEHSIRRRVKSLAALKREKEEVAEEAQKKQAYLRSQEELKEQLELTKAERLHRAFIHSHFIKEALEETDSPAWRVALERKSEREQRKARFYHQLLAHQAKQQEEHTFSLRQTVKDDLDEFETRRVPKGSHSKDSTLPSQKSVGCGLRSLSSTLDKADSAQSASLVSSASRQVSERQGDTGMGLLTNLIAIKEQKQRREKRKETLERRRKRFVQECGYYHSHLSTIRATTALEALVARETNSENGVRKDIENVILYKEIARENREQRCVEYEKQRRDDSEAAIDRDASFYGRLVLRYEDDGEMQLLQKAHLETATQAAKRHENELIASGIMRELVDFAMFAAGKREETLFERNPTLFLPEDTWTEYKVQFVHGCGLIESNNNSVVSTGDDDSQLLSKYQLEQYLASFFPFLQHSDYVGSSANGTALSPWCPRDAKFIGAADVLEDRFALGEEVKYVRWISHTMAVSSGSPATVELVEDQSEAESLPEAVTSEENTLDPAGEETQEEGTAEPDPVSPVDAFDAAVVPVAKPLVVVPPPKLLRILVFGSPFAGKKTHTLRIAEKYDLEVISVHQLLEQAIQNESELGIDAHRLLSSGGKIPSRIYSQLVLDAVRALENSIAASSHDEQDEANSSPTQKKGWIVFDLPGTAEQGQDFEELLTGFVDPALVPSPFDFESAIAPGCAKPALPPKFLHGKSGVDLVFYLDCSCDCTMERCLGQLEDETTHEKFHIVYNSPSHESTERHRLAHTNASLNCSALLSLQCLSVEGFAQWQKPWYDKFDSLREVSTSQSSGAEETHERMVAFVEAFYSQQEHQKFAEQQEREASELELMITDEQRQIRILGLESAIGSVREEHARCQQALQQAEEAKAKKEELAEHRQALEVAQKQLDAAIYNAKEAIHEETQFAERSAQVFSGKLSPRLSSLLANVWTDMESEYVSVMLRAFNLQREQRRRASDRSKLVIGEFCGFLRRPDTKQSLVNAFQDKFNLVIDEMRFDEATKLELHARTDILQDELTLIIETKMSENVEELSSVMKDGWLEDTCTSVAIVFQAALQSECDRFLVSFQVLVEGYAAASSSPGVLAPAIENLRVNQAMQDLSCRLFYDASVIEEASPAVTVATTPVPAATAPAGKGGAAAAKGKGKAVAAPTPAAVAAVVPVDPVKEGLGGGDPMAVDDLLASYDRALRKCDTIVQLVTSKVAENGGGGLENGGSSHPPTALTSETSTGAFDVCVINLLKGITYEHELVQRRIKFLRDAAQSACEQVTRSMRAVELTLQDVIDERRDREQAAVAALIKYIRTAIEAEVDLPLFINAKPEVLYRFPITVQLREDSLIDVDPLRRLVERVAVDPPPSVEEVHDVLLNARQRQELLELLQPSCCPLENGDDAAGDQLVMPVSLLVDILSSVTSTPLLPKAWRRCQPHIFAKIGSHFLIQSDDIAAAATGLIDINAFLTALGGDEALLHQAMEEQQQRQQHEEDDEPVVSIDISIDE